MAQAAKCFYFDEDRAFTIAGSVDRFFGGPVHRDYIVAVHHVTGDSIGLGAIGQIFQRHLPLHRRRIGPLIIFQHQHKGSFLHGGKIQAFMKDAGGAAAIADPSHRHNFLAEITASDGHTGHHRNQIAQHGNGRDDVQIFQIAEVAGAVLALGGRIILGHVLHENVARRNAFYEERSDVADHWREPVFFLQRVSRADGDRFLAEAGIQSADNFILAEQLHHGVFDGAIQPHEVVQVQILLPRQFFLHSRSKIVATPNCKWLLSRYCHGLLKVFELFEKFRPAHGSNRQTKNFAEVFGQQGLNFRGGHAALQ